MLKSIIIITVLAIVTYRVVLIVHLLEFDRTVYKHYPGQCTPIPTLNHGSENLERISGDKALVTTGFRFLAVHQKSFGACTGKVYLLDLNHLRNEPKLVTIQNYPGNVSDVDFHGISSWVDDKTGEVFVFIVTHFVTHSVVEIFQYNDEENSLYHIRTCQNEAFHVLNDVVAVSKQSFYVTNYGYLRGTLGAMFEMMLLLKWGSLLFYDGERANIVQYGFSRPNGINKSPDGRYIYLVVGGARTVLVYKRNTDESLDLVQTWPTFTEADNIIVDEDGNIWCAGHPVPYKTIMYLEDPKLISPSQVLLLKTKDSLITDMTEVFSDDGTLISGSSVALYAKNKLFVGSVFSQTVVCDVNYI